jgi:hypothetical protein
MYQSTIWSNYFEVGETAASSGHLELAERMHRAAHGEAMKGVSLPSQIMSSYSLGVVLLRMGQGAEGEKCLRKAVSLTCRHSEINCAYLVAAACALADSYWAQRAAEKAVPLLKLSLRRVMVKEGNLSPNLVPVLKRLVLIYTEKRFFARSDKYMRRLLEIQFGRICAAVEA